MCGIFCSIIKPGICCSASKENIKQFCGLHDGPNISKNVWASLNRRGPDLITAVGKDVARGWRATIVGNVLWTQGPHPTHQPLQDEIGNFLLWNGDILSGPLDQDDRVRCDSEVVFTWCKRNPLMMAAKVCGPYAWVYWDKKSRQLWFGRDALGRQSLLWSVSQHHILLTSVAHKSSDITEVPALGVYMIDLGSDQEVNIQLFPWAHLKTKFSSLSDIVVVEREPVTHLVLGDASTRLAWLNKEPSEVDLVNYNGSISLHELLNDSSISARVDKLLEVLTEAVECRVTRHPGVCKTCTRRCKHCSVAVLFSGGLDSTLLALLADKFIPDSIPIDLYNVAFQLRDGSFQVPDRITGILSVRELRELAPRRKWNFVEINVDRDKLNACRTDTITHLIHPLSSVLDDSIGSALWFAAQGQGLVDGRPYSSPARIVLLGMGADEQLGGYTRHRNTLRHSGQWASLGAELTTDTDRIARRNLGRDNRVVCDHGRQPRMPFLDERVVAHINSIAPWHRCQPIKDMPPGTGDKLLLRLAGMRLGLRSAATLPKRALQFGSRIANPKEKGDQLSDRLK